MSSTGRAARYVPGLERLSGRLRLDVGSRPVGMLVIENGEVDLRAVGDVEPDAVAICDSRETIEAIGRGALNPVVASLQNRLELTGDRAFAIRVILGLHASPQEAEEGARA